MGKKVYILKIDEATRKKLEDKQLKMAGVIKRITGKSKKPSFTRIAKLCISNPVWLDDIELIKLHKKKNKIL